MVRLHRLRLLRRRSPESARCGRERKKCGHQKDFDRLVNRGRDNVGWCVGRNLAEVEDDVAGIRKKSAFELEMKAQAGMRGALGADAGTGGGSGEG